MNEPKANLCDPPSRYKSPTQRLTAVRVLRGGGAGAGHRGRPSYDDYAKTVGAILRCDPFQLEDCTALAQLPGIQALAKQLQRSIFPTGVAIHTLLDRSVMEIEAIAMRQRDVNSSRLLAFLEIWYRQGGTVAEVAAALQLSRSHVAHSIQKRAIELVTRRFLEHAWRVEVPA